MDRLIKFKLSNEFREELGNAIKFENVEFIKKSLTKVNPADITTLLHGFNSDDSKYILDLLEIEIRAAIISNLDDELRNSFLENYDTEKIAKIIDYLESDDAVDLLNELNPKRREEVLSKMENTEKEANIIDLLRYEEDVAGGLMGKELIKANDNWTVVQCIDEIRRQAENVNKLYAVYVVNNEDKLIGRVSLKKIILSNDSTKISDIYEKNVISVETYLSEEEVAKIMSKYDLDAVPVVNIHGKLMGRITIDDIVDVITELADEERQIMSGITGDVAQDDSIWNLSKARLPWLIVGVIGGFISAKFIGVFEKDLVQITAIAFFIPLIQATGGNVGIQSSSIVVQSLATPSFFIESVVKRLAKVLLVALLNGFVISTIAYLFNWFTRGDMVLSIVVSLSLFFVVFIASFLGTITPILLHKMGLNPALASGPFITTTNDLVGLAIYFYVVHLFLF